MDFKNANIQDLWNFLEDVNYEASVMNVSATQLLEKYKITQRISKDIFQVLNNTLQALKKGTITVNNLEVTPYEASEEPSRGVDFAISIEDSIKLNSYKDLASQIDNYQDWEFLRTNELGTWFKPAAGDGDVFIANKPRKSLALTSEGQILYEYTLGKDFTRILHIEQEGIYLLRDIGDKVEGVVKFRWSVK